LSKRKLQKESQSMLLNLAQWLQTLSPDWGFLRIFQYITFRAVMAALTSLLIGLIAGPMVIRRLTALKIGQPIRGYGMETHMAKSGTPTMGGVLILLSIAISTLLWFDITNRFVWIVLIVPLVGLTTGAKWSTKTPRACARARNISGSLSLACWLRCVWFSVFLKVPTCVCSICL
jgi:hypothetical protein